MVKIGFNTDISGVTKQAPGKFGMIEKMDTSGIKIGRINPANPAEDKAILGAVYDMTSGADPKKVFDAYPELSGKWDAVQGYLYDAQNTDISETDLYKQYPELSSEVKTKIRSQFKTEIEKNKATQSLKDNPLSVGEGAAAVGLGVSQGAGNVGYNIVGKPSVALGEWVGSKLENTKFQKGIQELGRKIFGEEEMKKFSELEALRKAGDNANTPEENANIMRAVGGRRLEQSTAGKVGKFIGEEGAKLAISLPMGGAVSGATKLATGVARGTAGAIARGAVAGGITGAGVTAVDKIGSEGRLPTLKEIEKGAAIGAVAGGIFSKSFQPSKKAIGATIMPKMTPSVATERANKGLTKVNALGKITNQLSKREQKMVEASKDFINPSKTNVWNLNKTHDALSKETEKLIKVVKNNNYTRKPSDITKEMDKVKLPPLLKSDRTLAGAYKIVRKEFEKILNKAPKTAEGLLSARKEFDGLVTKSFPNLYNSDTLTPIKAAITSLRKVPNVVLNNNIGNDIVKASLEKQSLLYDVANNLSTKVEKVGTSAVSRTLLRNKELLKALGLLAGGAALSKIVSSAIGGGGAGN